MVQVSSVPPPVPSQIHGLVAPDGSFAAPASHLPGSSGGMLSQAPLRCVQGSSSFVSPGNEPSQRHRIVGGGPIRSGHADPGADRAAVREGVRGAVLGVAHAEETVVIIGRDGRGVVTALACPRVGVEGQRVDDGGWCAFGTGANEAGITDTDMAVDIGRCAPADPIVAAPHWCPLSAGPLRRTANGEPQGALDIVRGDRRVVVTAFASPQDLCGGIVDVFPVADRAANAGRWVVRGPAGADITIHIVRRAVIRPARAGPGIDAVAGSLITGALGPAADGDDTGGIVHQCVVNVAFAAPLQGARDVLKVPHITMRGGRVVTHTEFTGNVYAAVAAVTGPRISVARRGPGRTVAEIGPATDPAPAVYNWLG